MPVVGFLDSSSADEYAPFLAAFRAGLNEAGFVEGGNVAIEYRWADGQYDRLPALATDLIDRQVRVIVVFDFVTATAAKAATATIPIVFSVGDDPVVSGLVTSLNRPGGNLTGTSRLNVELEPKRLEMLHELIPDAKAFALLVNPTNPNAARAASEMAAAAQSLGMALHVLRASSDQDLDLAFGQVRPLGAGGIVIAPDPFFLTRSARLAELALAYGIPAICQYPEFTAAGGFASYAGSPIETYRLMGLYIARILRGEKPADLPIQQFDRLELILNLKTAKALGLTVPLPILALANKVIE
jgi:putative ABC transport system substrate-binding protein